MKKSIGKTVALAGVMAALVFVVLTLETYVFSIFIKPSTCFLSLPIAISLCLYADWKKMFLGGTIFGFCSFILSFIMAYTIFYNPLVSILPRVMFGVVGYGVFVFFKFIFKKSKSNFVRQTLPIGIAGACAVLTNTILTLLAMYISDPGGSFMTVVFQTILALNFIPEFVTGIVLVPIFVKVLRKINHSDREQSPSETEEIIEN